MMMIHIVITLPIHTDCCFMNSFLNDVLHHFTNKTLDLHLLRLFSYNSFILGHQFIEFKCWLVGSNAGSNVRMSEYKYKKMKIRGIGRNNFRGIIEHFHIGVRTRRSR